MHKSAVANQARFLLQAEGKARHNTLNDDWFVASAEPVAKPSLRPDLETTLTMEQHQTLLTCLEAHSDWIARSAATIAANLDAPSWDSEQLFDKDMSRRTLWRAGLLYLVAILSARDERTLLARAAASDSPDYRYAASLTISVAPNLDPDGLIKRALCQDPDLSVRPKAARDLSPAPTRWTCSRCRQVNDVGAEDCSTCDEGTRPDLEHLTVGLAVRARRLLRPTAVFEKRSLLNANPTTAPDDPAPVLRLCRRHRCRTARRLASWCQSIT